MKKIKLLILSVFCLLLYGCGHSTYHKVEGTGLYGRIPLPNGNSLVQVAIGDLNITSGILRGGATLDQNTSKGGTFGSVSLGRHTYLSTSPALNQGYIAQVLTSKNTNDKTKQLVAEYLITRKQQKPPASGVTSVNSGSATGHKEELPIVKPTKVGMDNLVEKAGDTIVSVAPVVKDGTVKVVDSATKTIQNSVVESTNNLVKISDNATVIAICLAIIAVIVGIIVLLIKIKKRKYQI